MRVANACMSILLIMAMARCTILTDAIIHDNVMRTSMPVDRLVYVAIRGKGNVHVQARLNGATKSIECRSPDIQSVCVLWNGHDSSIGMQTASKDVIALDLVGSVEKGQGHMSYKVISGSAVVLPSRSASLQLNAIKGVQVLIPAECPDNEGVHLSMSSENAQVADYMNRLTMDIHNLENGVHLYTATDASGRQASISLNKDTLAKSLSGSSLLVKLQTQIPSIVHLSATCQATVSHLAQTTPSTFNFKGKLSSMEVVSHLGDDPKFDELADDHDTHWLRDGATEFKVLNDEFETITRVGLGHFGAVYRVKDKQNGLVLVAKLLRKSKSMANDNGANEINREVSVLSALPDHPNVCKFYRAFETLEEVSEFNLDRTHHGRLRQRESISKIYEKTS